MLATLVLTTRTRANAQMTHIQVQKCVCYVFYKHVSHTKHTVPDLNTCVILKQGQVHPTWCGLVDQKQGYNHANFERPKANIKVFVKSGHMSIISL